ncbi:hypothetical protein CLHUN_05940 [Ruminiclostridium hungatei]|uniref:Methyltransferase FkbM domain-containing protein n=1 Tax=Ruminiclostridium hungatei TaxID=48256 RepID=A0A1V4SR00_RUMHU|nr:FkbM family methyltransferase [Ruminiclostridium hungatei]OPX45657.1 hypothetical protein CLHUN_05940 [Ruminiclostridium hungatei]
MVDYELEIRKFIDDNWGNIQGGINELINKVKAAKYICIFGAGGVGRELADYLKSINIKIDFFCDNNKSLWDKEVYNGIKCISLDELKLYKEDVFILITGSRYSEIKKQLDLMSFYSIVMANIILKTRLYLGTTTNELLKNNVCSLLELLEDDKSKEIVVEIVKKWFTSILEYNTNNHQNIKSDNQYFTEEIVALTENEIFVDAGAYDGDTVRYFLEKVNYRFDGVIAYELNKNNYDILCHNIAELDDEVKSKILPYNLGLYNKTEKIKYSSNISSSNINLFADDIGQVVRLDEHTKKPITFIKMDIEGAEIKALEGAEEIIRVHKPKLAICVYHEPYHLWEIPFLIKKYVPDYKLFIRHHSDLGIETVCYAVI